MLFNLLDMALHLKILLILNKEGALNLKFLFYFLSLNFTLFDINLFAS